MCIICGQCVAAEIMPECATHDVANVTSEENGTQLNLSRQAVPLELGTIDSDSMKEKTLKSFACNLLRGNTASTDFCEMINNRKNIMVN